MSLDKIDNLLLNQQLTTEAVGVDDVKEALSSVSGEVVQKEVETKAEDELVVVDELEDDVENNPEVKEENEEDKSDEVIEITAEDFKDFFSKNEKMDELIAGYGYETVFEYFDEDKDGKISKEEIKKVSSSADSLEDITFGEMKTFLEKKGKGASEEEKGVTKEELNEIVNSLKEQMMAQMQAQQQAQMGGSSGGGGYSGGSSGGGGNVGSVNNTTGANATTGDKTAKDLDNIEDLEALKAEKTENLDTLNEDLEKAFDGEDEKLTELKENMDELEEEYKTLLEEEAEENEEVKAKKEEIEAKEEEIKTNEDTTKEKELKLNETNQKISEKENEIAGLESEKSALESSLASLQSVEVTDENEAEISAQIAEVQAQIDAVQAKIDAANEELDALNEEKATLEGEIETLKSENETLKGERETLEGELSEMVSEKTKEALGKYQEAREAYENAKTERIDTIKEDITTVQDEITEIETKIQTLKAEEIEKENSVNTQGSEEFLSALEQTGGDAWNNFDKLCNELGMSKEETAAYLSNLCTAEEWGNGCIDPVLLTAQICQESGFDADIYGDSGLALGLGQFHECAVDEVNNQYGTNYTYADRANPTKALEMMVLLLKYDHKRTNGDTDAMLAMYNQGNPNGINTSAGQNYVKHVKSRINQ